MGFFGKKIGTYPNVSAGIAAVGMIDHHLCPAPEGVVTLLGEGKLIIQWDYKVLTNDNDESFVKLLRRPIYYC